MNTQDYKKALDAAQAEMDELLAKRSALDKRLTQLKATIETLSALLDGPPKGLPMLKVSATGIVKEFGISHVIREVLSESKIPLSPTEIRNRLVMKGVNLDEYANEMAVIHNTLKRLEGQNEVSPVRNPAGQTIAYTITRDIAELITVGYRRKSEKK